MCFFSDFVDCSMAPPSANWQRLLKVKPTDIDANDDTKEEQNEQLGGFYMNVRI